MPVESLTLKMMAARRTRRRQARAKAKLLQACYESEAAAVATSVLLDVVKTLRTRYAWTAEEIHGFLKALNEVRSEES